MGGRGDFEYDFNAAIINRNKRNDVGKGVLAGLAETAVDVQNVLNESGVVLEVDLCIGMYLELREGLFLDHPVGKLDETISDQNRG